MVEEKPVTFVSIKERVLLNRSGSDKETYHIVLDIKDLNLSYSPGDCVGIYPENSSDEVKTSLSLLNRSGDEKVYDRKGRELSFHEFLKVRANLSRITRKFYNFIQERVGSIPLSEKIEDYTVEDILPFATSLTSQEITDHLLPLLPRLYSIASSMQDVGSEIHLLVKLSEYDSGVKKRFGTCSNYLCRETPLHKPLIPIYLDIGREFKLPDCSAPIIMVGPGTGVAPFRGFMQERLRLGHSKNWLFFGERKQKFDYYYEDFWKRCVTGGHLKLNLAFSRDQEEKIYVQHHLLTHGDEIWNWLQEGAYFYVCGDANRMAKDVEETLQKIFLKKMSEKEARDYLRALRKEKRYLRDVY